jgi:hypothetical protein
MRSHSLPIRAAVLAVAALSLAACATGADDASSSDAAASSSSSASDAGGASDPGKLTITIDGKDHEFAPDSVRCQGGSGQVERATATVGAKETPFVAAEPEGTLMVKMAEDAAPATAHEPENVTADAESMTFSNTAVGDDMTVDGTINCTMHQAD